MAVDASRVLTTYGGTQAIDLICRALLRPGDAVAVETPGYFLLFDRLRQAGVRHHGAGGNYLLIWPAQPAAAVERRLRQAGILVRSMAGKPLIDGALRVSIGSRTQMARFWQAYGAIEGFLPAAG